MASLGGGLSEGNSQHGNNQNNYNHGFSHRINTHGSTHLRIQATVCGSPGAAPDRACRVTANPGIACANNQQRLITITAYILQKTVLERFIAFCLLATLLVPLAVVAILIVFDSPGPVFFRQPRLGLNDQIFNIWKFRTMYRSDEPANVNAGRQARRSDSRITRVGAYLRKYSIDEFPQLINVVRGDMALIGPRPHPVNMRFNGQTLQRIVPNYADRHSVLPGITGWAQVNGCRGETVFEEQIQRRVLHDLFYIASWSPLLDMKIIFLTLAREMVSETAF